jgi:sporulation protein YlmC with PRC-barrel domain
MAKEADRVVPLGSADDLHVAQGEPDVRGWEVVTTDGKPLGRVGELWVDADALRVRYLDVEVSPELVAGDRRLLIPIGYARLAADRDCVIVDELSPEEVRDHPAYRSDVSPSDREGVPAYSHGLFGETVRADLAAAEREQARAGRTPDEAFDDSRFYAARRGGVVDPLAEARWGQVRGDEEGIRSGETTETDLSGADVPGDAGLGGDAGAREGITGGMGDPGGER